MENVKISFGRKLLTAVLVFLTATMLLLAALYIGGSHFSAEGSAINLSRLPESTVKVGGTYGENTPVYEKNLLAVSFAAISFGGRGGGAYGNEAAAKALFEFAAEPIHFCLSSQSTLLKISTDEFLSATYGDYLYIGFVSPLPYQILYALTGENVSTAGSDCAVNADRIILSFPTNKTARLYISDGENCYVSNTKAQILGSAAYTLAGDSRLSDFSVKESGIAVSDASLMLSLLTLKTDDALTDTSKKKLYSLFGYEYAAESNARSISAVAPHGSMRITASSLSFNAAQDSGISISDFLPNAKSALDITIYDMLSGCVSLVEKIFESAPEVLKGISPYLCKFYRDGDTYTVIFGALSENVPIEGSAFPHLAKITMQNGRFKSINVRFLQIEKDNLSVPGFPSRWQYDHAAESATVRSLYPAYRPTVLPAENVGASWYFTGEKFSGGDRN